MLNHKISLLFSYNHLKNIYLFSKIDRFFNTSLSKPTIISMVITKKCNSHCKHCDNWKRKLVKELDTEQWKHVISKFRRWIGPFYLTISGGEPFLREDLFEIIEFAHTKNIFTEVITNGLLILDRIKEIENSKLTKLAISLDGTTARTHDFLRGYGSFKKITSAITALRENKKDLMITLNSVMFKQNFQELPALVHFVKANKLNGVYFRILCWEYYNRDYSEDWFLKNPLWPRKDEKTEKILEELIRLKKEGYPIINSVKYLQLAKEYFKNPDMLKSQKMTCLAPYESLIITQEGEVILCFYNHLGNILEDEFSLILESKKLKQLKRGLLSCRKSCMLRDWHFGDTAGSKLLRAKIALFGK